MRADPYARYRDCLRGRPALLLGNGPSLNLVKFARVTAPIIGMNRSWKAYQARWHCLMYRDDHIEPIVKRHCRPDTVFSLMQPHQAHALRRRVPGLDVVRFPHLRDPCPLGTPAFTSLEKGTPCKNTGQFAIEVALWLGCDPIYLIGYDLGYDDGHFFDDVSPNHEWRDKQRELFRVFATHVARKFTGRRILNLNRESFVDAFEFADLEAVYA